MIAAALLAVLVAMALVVVRALRGPSTFDRLLAANSIGNGAILVLALFGFLQQIERFVVAGPHDSNLPCGEGIVRGRIHRRKIGFKQLAARD